jgi:hypothetical protein
MAHRAEQAAHFGWRLTRGDYISGLRTRNLFVITTGEVKAADRHRASAVCLPGRDRSYRAGSSVVRRRRPAEVVDRDTAPAGVPPYSRIATWSCRQAMTMPTHDPAE